MRASDPLNNATTYAYDTIGRPTSQVSPKGNAAGADPAAHTTRYAYNAFGDVVSVTDPLAHITKYGYDPNRNLTSVEDANRRVTTHVYNQFDERIETRRPDGSVLKTAYDKNGNVASQTDPLLKTRTYAYDPLNRQTSLTDELFRTTSFTYDKVDNLKTSRDPAGRTTTYGYDNADQLKTVTYGDATTPNVTNISYKATGERTSMTDGTGTSTWEWDSLGRLTRSTTAGATVRYGYDLSDELTTLTYPSSKVVTRGYDLAGRLTSVRDWLNNTTAFDYDANGELVKQRYPNGTVADLTRDAADRLMASSHAGPSGAFLALSYARDDKGLLTAENARSYTYDSADRLKSGGNPGAVSYDYDAGDNLKRAVLPEVTKDLTYDAAHQITGLTETRPARRRPSASASTPRATARSRAGRPPRRGTAMTRPTA